ncbi:MotA/TolQ/ExbB proton channel family protein [Cellvibrio sp. pealriver]|uniref:MotA/TolQ/ExbB proton channel family protein n=1 Tax=Cellvibrio sp. pealriver TaxID=1622269 RepID=UPI00069FBFAF|nr:MotA/TolQ/ExbB proton channel family protein [Cellvibrio sp. pealriver]
MNSASEFYRYIVVEGGPLTVAIFSVSLLIYWMLLNTFDKLRLIESSDQVGDQFANQTANQSANLKEVGNDIRVLMVLVASTPLLGLLGTVIGLINAFQSMSAGENIYDGFALSVSQALITTQAGLIVATPAMFALGYLRAKRSSLLSCR